MLLNVDLVNDFALVTGSCTIEWFCEHFCGRHFPAQRLKVVSPLSTYCFTNLCLAIMCFDRVKIPPSLLIIPMAEIK